MKNQSFARRMGFALAGLTAAFRNEASLRFHTVAAAGVVAVLLWLRPSPGWWAALLLTAALVIAAELFNTALEALADHLHPAEHPNIKAAKDYAAAAVLIASAGALAVAAAFVYDVLRERL